MLLTFKMLNLIMSVSNYNEYYKSVKRIYSLSNILNVESLREFCSDLLKSLHDDHKELPL